LKKLAIVSFGHADPVMHYAKTMSAKYDVELIFVFALNKRIESILNFEKENLTTGFLPDEQVKRILGDSIGSFIGNSFKVRFFINHNLKVRSIKNIILANRLAKVLKNYDIVHFNGMDATLMLINKFLKHRKKIFTIHDVKIHSGENNSKLNIAEAYIKWLIKSKYQIIIQNKADYEDVLKSFPASKNKITLIPFKALSIYKYFYEEDIKSEKSDLLFFGRMSQYKGLKYLVAAIDIVKKVIPDVKVMIAGSGDIKNDFPEEKKTGNYIIHNRYITNEEMAGYIKNTKIVVCPYTDATQSGVAMTSFAFYKPIIASSVGGFLDVIENGKTGILIPPANPEILAESIISLLSDSNKLNDMSENIKQVCENGFLSWNTIVDDVIKVYEKE
jgi:glycosyltransferase involved in cell wall biosynthesis